ncbi:hypothetical protein Tco_0085351 [Tanacetum coccineum]
MVPLIVQIWARSGFDSIEEFLGCLRDCQELYTMFSTLAGKLRLTAMGFGPALVDSHMVNHLEMFVTPRENYSKVLKYNWEKIPFELEGEASEPERRPSGIDFQTQVLEGFEKVFILPGIFSKFKLGKPCRQIRFCSSTACLMGAASASELYLRGTKTLRSYRMCDGAHFYLN